MEKYSLFEEYVKDYLDEAYHIYPNLFGYLSLNNAIGSYFSQIENLITDKDIDMNNHYSYQYHIDGLTYLDLCQKILSSLDISYWEKLQEYLKKGYILFEDDEIDTFAHCNCNTSHPDIRLNRTYTIEDVFITIHEFFHSLHLVQYHNHFHPEWYLTTECISSIVEFYSAMYLYHNDLFKSDVIIYMKHIAKAMFDFADASLFNGVILEIYDQMESLSIKDIKYFLKAKDIDQRYINIFDLFEEDDEFDYHVNCTYNLGFPVALFIANKMLNDVHYIKLFNKQFKNISTYDVASFLAPFGLIDVLNNNEFLYDLMQYVNIVITDLCTKDKLNIKPYLLEMR